MPSLDVRPLPIHGAFVVSGGRRGDARGYLERMFDAEALSLLLGGRSIVQVNRTVTLDAGTVRGLHCQLPPSADMKIVSCCAGAAYDVMVDVRGDSPTFGRSWAMTLEADSSISVVIPEGCAHGLQTLQSNTQMLYLHTAEYDASSEAGLHPLDASLGIEWPLEVTVMSDRDASETRGVEWFRGVPW